jgi:hypothetical protein
MTFFVTVPASQKKINPHDLRRTITWFFQIKNRRNVYMNYSHEKTYSIGDAAEMIGVTQRQLRNWEQQN